MTILWINFPNLTLINTGVGNYPPPLEKRNFSATKHPTTFGGSLHAANSALRQFFCHFTFRGKKNLNNFRQHAASIYGFLHQLVS